MDWRVFYRNRVQVYIGKAKTSNALSDQFRQFEPQGQPSQLGHKQQRNYLELV